MKKRCYPWYSYAIYLILTIIFFVFSIGPMIIETNEELFIKILFSSIMIIFGCTMFGGYLWTKQHYHIRDNKVSISNIFGIIKVLDLDQCDIEIVDLPTYFSWVLNTNKKWICIYSNMGYVPKFQNGLNNSKKYERIQIVYSEETEIALKKMQKTAKKV